MRNPKVPKDWLVQGFQWGVRAPNIDASERWLTAERMASEAGERDVMYLESLRRSSQFQDAICVEVARLMPIRGYRFRTELAHEVDAPEGLPRTLMGRSTIANLLSGQRLISLSEIAQFEYVFQARLMTVVVDSPG